MPALLEKSAQELELALLERSVQELEKKILKIESTQEQLMKLDWITLVRKYDFVLTNLRNQLEEKRKAILKIPQAVSIWNTLATLIGFRLLVLFSNLRCLALLKLELRRWTWR